MPAVPVRYTMPLTEPSNFLAGLKGCATTRALAAATASVTVISTAAELGCAATRLGAARSRAAVKAAAAVAAMVSCLTVVGSRVVLKGATWMSSRLLTCHSAGMALGRRVGLMDRIYLGKV